MDHGIYGAHGHIGRALDDSRIDGIEEDLADLDGLDLAPAYDVGPWAHWGPHGHAAGHARMHGEAAFGWDFGHRGQRYGHHRQQWEQQQQYGQYGQPQPPYMGQPQPPMPGQPAPPYPGMTQANNYMQSWKRWQQVHGSGPGQYQAYQGWLQQYGGTGATINGEELDDFGLDFLDVDGDEGLALMKA